MRLYRITAASNTVDWAGTQADAKAAANENSGEWKEEDVPTDKTGLIAWLKKNAVSLGEKKAKK
jgi:hypothetical protein